MRSMKYYKKSYIADKTVYKKASRRFRKLYKRFSRRQRWSKAFELIGGATNVDAVTFTTKQQNRLNYYKGLMDKSLSAMELSATRYALLKDNCINRIEELAAQRSELNMKESRKLERRENKVEKRKDLQKRNSDEAR